MFRVGQKVVCIDAKPRKRGHVARLTEGSVYTISKLGPGDNDGAELFLVEMGAISHPWFGFYADRFRPAVERKTDISVFTKILDNVRVKTPPQRETPHEERNV